MSMISWFQLSFEPIARTVNRSLTRAVNCKAGLRRRLARTGELSTLTNSGRSHSYESRFKSRLSIVRASSVAQGTNLQVRYRPSRAMATVDRDVLPDKYDLGRILYSLKQFD